MQRRTVYLNVELYKQKDVKNKIVFKANLKNVLKNVHSAGYNFKFDITYIHMPSPTTYIVINATQALK